MYAYYLVPGPVRNITAFSAIRNVTLTWLAPLVKHGQVYYNVTYRDTDGPDNQTKHFGETNQTSIVIHGLEEYILYQFMIQSFTTEGGNGPTSFIMIRTFASGKDLKVFMVNITINPI